MAELTELDLTAEIVDLTAAVVDVPSESHDEALLADLVERALRAYPHLSVERDGNTVVARTNMGHSERVLIGGHLDTVPAAENLPSHLDGDRLYGLGACDMKGGVAVALQCAALVTHPVRDVTYVFYECEEIESEFNGLKRLAETKPEWLAADLALLMEPSNADVEAGCQGTMRAEIRTSGRRAHSARWWLGQNAIHDAVEMLNRLQSYQPKEVTIDGLVYREGLSAVKIAGGVAGNVIPDECVLTVNYRFAPNVDEAQAEAHVREVFDGFDVTIVDAVAGAMPGLDRPAAKEFLAAVGATPKPKFGWTDVARFSVLGIPAMNFGPGNAELAHTREEYVEVGQLRESVAKLRAWLSAAGD